jgi:hypothetical protein
VIAVTPPAQPVEMITGHGVFGRLHRHDLHHARFVPLHSGESLLALATLHGDSQIELDDQSNSTALVADLVHLIFPVHPILDAIIVIKRHIKLHVILVSSSLFLSLKTKGSWASFDLKSISEDAKLFIVS